MMDTSIAVSMYQEKNSLRPYPFFFFLWSNCVDDPSNFFDKTHSNGTAKDFPCEQRSMTLVGKKNRIRTLRLGAEGRSRAHQ